MGIAIGELPFVYLLERLVIVLAHAGHGVLLPLAIVDVSGPLDPQLPVSFLVSFNKGPLVYVPIVVRIFSLAVH